MPGSTGRHAAMDMVGMPLGPDHQPLAKTTTGRPMMATSGVAEAATPAGETTEAMCTCVFVV